MYGIYTLHSILGSFIFPCQLWHRRIVTLQHSKISTLKVIKGISGTKGREEARKGEWRTWKRMKVRTRMGRGWGGGGRREARLRKASSRPLLPPSLPGLACLQSWGAENGRRGLCTERAMVAAGREAAVLLTGAMSLPVQAAPQAQLVLVPLVCGSGNCC